MTKATKKVSRKTEPRTEREQHYILSATNKIKSVALPRDIYIALYGSDPTILQLQMFRNRINGYRSNPSAALLGRCVEALPELHDVTLSEFFGINKPVATKKKDA